MKKTYTFYHPEKTDFFKIKCEKLVVGTFGKEVFWQCLINDLIVAQFPISWIMVNNSCL